MSRRGAREGSIAQRKDGRWQGRVHLGYEGGKRIRKHYYGASREEVAAKLTRALAEHQRGIAPVRDERQTVGSFVERWLVESVRPTVRPRTFESYELIVRLHIVPRLGGIPIARLAPQDVQSLLVAKLAAGLSPRSVQYVHAVLRRALGQAYRWGIVARNVATLVDAPRVARAEVRPLTPAEARRFLDAIRGDRLEALYTVALALGLRQGEALGLRWTDVDLEAGTLTVNRSLQRVPRVLRDATAGRLVLVEPKTARSRRTIAMPAIVAAALRAHRTRQLEERLLAGSRWTEAGLVFTSTIGTPLDSRNVTHGFQRVLAGAGLPRQRFHDLRHACASFLLAQGVPARVVMEVLGHAQIGMTLGVYGHLLPTMQAEAAGRMDALLTPDAAAADV